MLRVPFLQQLFERGPLVQSTVCTNFNSPVLGLRSGRVLHGVCGRWVRSMILLCGVWPRLSLPSLLPFSYACVCCSFRRPPVRHGPSRQARWLWRLLCCQSGGAPRVARCMPTCHGCYKHNTQPLEEVGAAVSKLSPCGKRRQAICAVFAAPPRTQFF